LRESRRSRAELERWFDALLAAHGAALGRLAASYTRTTGEREDLLQEIAFAIWGALPRFRGECSERTFVYRIAHNRAIAHISRRRLPVVAPDADLEVEDAQPDPELALSRDQQARRLMAAIHRLPVTYAQVVTLTLEGLSYEEIADVLGISESNVGARLTRARSVLRKLVEDRDGS
jgi:RNA polymerase sigma-70 factor (ECF subfamily)